MGRCGQRGDTGNDSRRFAVDEPRNGGQEKTGLAVPTILVALLAVTVSGAGVTLEVCAVAMTVSKSAVSSGVNITERVWFLSGVKDRAGKRRIGKRAGDG